MVKERKERKRKQKQARQSQCETPRPNSLFSAILSIEIVRKKTHSTLRQIFEESRLNQK